MSVILKLVLTVEETRGVLEALQRFPMNQVRPLVQKIEDQAKAQLEKKPGEAVVEGAPTNEQLLNEVDPVKGPVVNG